MTAIWSGPMWKPSRSKRKLGEAKGQRALEAAEEKQKREVRKRDRGCRFPLCGCPRLKWRLEVSHGEHKGMGGNPAGDRSLAALMVQLCVHRHQHGAISVHARTLRPKFLSREKFNGPIAWEVDVHRLRGDWMALKTAKWVEAARESAVGVWEPLTLDQRELLEWLAEMEE